MEAKNSSKFGAQAHSIPDRTSLISRVKTHCYVTMQRSVACEYQNLNEDIHRLHV